MVLFSLRFLRLLWLWCLTAAALFAGGRGWAPAEWRGEKAWVSVSARGWTAVVSEERARLIALMPPGGGENLLFADQKDEFSWGGHRFWLGPQSQWSALWPPPADWERSAAARAEAEGATLRLTHPRTSEDYPAITRSYAWRGGVLHCSASWTGERFHGIHILQLPPRAVVRVKRKISAALPNGYVLLPIFRRKEPLVDREVSPAVARVEGNTVTLRNTGVTEKIGVPPQDIVAEIGEHRLLLRRGRMEGFSDATPDFGMVTQVFLGSAESVFTEIEQLTAYGSGGVSFSEIRVEPGFVAATHPVRRHPVRR